MGSHVLGGRNAPIPYGKWYPQTVSSADGPYVFGSDGRRYVDLWMGFGTLLLGHRDEILLRELGDSLRTTGLMHSFHHALEEQVAETLCRHIASAESVRFMMTGQEATSYCLRLSRAHTGRERVLLVEGGYHGVNDATSYRAPAGIPAGSLALTDRIPFNDTAALEDALSTTKYAAFIVEPVLGNAGVRRSNPAYLRAARQLCNDSGTVLVFDEVMTGFRNSMACAQGDFGVVPDLTALAKALGGGVPIAAVCGRNTIMREFYPHGRVAQEGTFYGSPLSLAAARISLGRYESESVPERIGQLVERVLEPLRELSVTNERVSVSSYGGMFGIEFLSADAQDRTSYTAFSDHLARAGFLVPPLQTEAAFLSVSHAPIVEQISFELLAAAKYALGLNGGNN